MTAKNPLALRPVGSEAPKFVNAIIEIPTGSKAKYELEKERGWSQTRPCKVLFSAVHYPGLTSFRLHPHDLIGGHQPLDILVLRDVGPSS